jgi:hypothetical protein
MFCIILCAGKIQSLKKSSTKGDKKKKKEIAEEIARLELELEKQQNEELLQLKHVGFMTPTVNSIHYLSWKFETEDCKLVMDTKQNTLIKTNKKPK